MNFLLSLLQNLSMSNGMVLNENMPIKLYSLQCN